MKWKGTHRNTYEPADCLIGWEAEMQKVDEECERCELLPKINPAVEAQKACELAAACKAAELTKRKERLQRLCSWSGLSRCALSLGIGVCTFHSISK